MIPNDPVKIVEVGPRDSLQNVCEYLETGKKINLIRRLAGCGIKEIELGSFVHPGAIPQFKDIKEVVDGVISIKGVKLTTLVPNLKGAQKAFQSGLKQIVFVFSVSQSHNFSNVRRTPDESLEELKKIKELSSSYPEAVIRVNLATTFGCPFEIRVKKKDILNYIEKTVEIGIKEITLCDSIGFGNPKQVEDIVTTCMKNFPKIIYNAHFHNTRGLGLANALAAYESGIRSFESSIAGLGGCPFTPGSSGNIATEDMVFMFEEMGIETGVDIQNLLSVSRYMKEILPDVNLESSLLRAGIPKQLDNDLHF